MWKTATKQQANEATARVRGIKESRTRHVAVARGYQTTRCVYQLWQFHYIRAMDTHSCSLCVSLYIY